MANIFIRKVLKSCETTRLMEGDKNFSKIWFSLVNSNIIIGNDANCLIERHTFIELVLEEIHALHPSLNANHLSLILFKENSCRGKWLLVQCAPQTHSVHCKHQVLLRQPFSLCVHQNWFVCMFHFAIQNIVSIQAQYLKKLIVLFHQEHFKVKWALVFFR